jgi:hypothetical protein
VLSRRGSNNVVAFATRSLLFIVSVFATCVAESTFPLTKEESNKRRHWAKHIKPYLFLLHDLTCFKDDNAQSQFGAS